MAATRTLLIAFIWLAPYRVAFGDDVSFDREVAPLLAAHCYECHGPDEERREAGLRLDERESATSVLESGKSAIIPGDAELSELLRRVTSSGDDRMPPLDSADALTVEQTATLRSWIDLGAKYEQHWALKPLDRSAPPADATDWAETPVDRFIESRLKRAQLRPAKEADRYVLIRRLYFDLLGLPPTAEQIRHFVGNPKPDAYSKLVDQLLASPAYGERWGRHWLDVARYGDSNGGDENHAYPLAHHYRDYVIEAFNDDRSYDRFVTQQLAGDLLGPTNDEHLTAQRLTATGYLAIGMKILAEQDPVKKQADLVDEQIDTFGRTFLGLSLGCARCHDHKFDPIPTRDYYALAGIFHSSEAGDKPLDSASHNEAMLAYRKQIAEIRSQLDTIQQDLEDVGGTGLILREAESFDRGNVVIDNDRYGKGIGIISDPGAQQNFAEFDIQVPESATYFLQLRYAAEEARPGQILINGELAKEAAIARKTGGWNPDAQAWVTEGVFPLNRGVNVVRLQSEPMMSHIDQLRLVRSDQVDAGSLDRFNTLTDALSELQGEEPQPQMVMAVTDGNVKNVKLHLRGSHLELGEEVPRGFLSILDGGWSSTPNDGSGRLQLARWLTQNETASTLTARVIANRVWLWHFGRGLVSTPDDFGIRGDPPTHPRLLDYLAAELIDHEWSIKRLHRLIVTSQTYRMQSTVGRQGDGQLAARVDPENRLLWKRQRVRIDAESLRDALLSQSDELIPGLRHAPMNVKSQDPSPQDMAANLLTYEASRRRSVYLPVVRSNVYEFLTLFDFPNAASPVGKRDVTTIPTQALWMMNSPFIVARAQDLARRCEEQDSQTAIRNLYLNLFAREAEQHEIRKGHDFVTRFSLSADKRKAWTAYCQVLLTSNEYLFLK